MKGFFVVKIDLDKNVIATVLSVLLLIIVAAMWSSVWDSTFSCAGTIVHVTENMTINTLYYANTTAANQTGGNTVHPGQYFLRNATGGGLMTEGLNYTFNASGASILALTMNYSVNATYNVTTDNATCYSGLYRAGKNMTNASSIRTTWGSAPADIGTRVWALSPYIICLILFGSVIYHGKKSLPGIK